MVNNYQRLFYIFKKMDSDVGYPTGYIKVEINCEVAKLQISLSNLLSIPDLRYKLYGIRKDDNQLNYTVICDIPNINGRADVKINIDSHKMGSKEFKIEEINVFAVITQAHNTIRSIKCPLVAYTKGELSWRKELETLILNEENPERDSTNQIKAKFDNKRIDVAHIESSSSIDQVDENTISIMNEIIDQKNSNDIVNQKINNEIEQPGSIGIQEKQEPSEKVCDVQEYIPFQNYSEAPTNINNDITSKFESAITSIYDIEGSSALEKKSVPELTDEDILTSSEKNFNEISLGGIADDKTRIGLDMESLKVQLDETFENYSPFKMKSKRFKWWKINSPGLLNNILFRNNVKTYLLFNPKVMLAHYKYKYIIFGIRVDRYLGKEYFICGIPGIYSIDENPFGSMGSWAQIEGYKPKYGAFGYWLILIDPRTGKLLKMK